MYPTLLMISWSMACLRRGVWPEQRESGANWRADDTMWENVAGTPLGFKAVPVFLKMDLKELSSSLGMVATGSKRYPCALCRCTRGQDSWETLEDLSAMEHGWEPNTLDTYLSAVHRCQFKRYLGTAEYTAVRQALWNDLRPKGNRGRRLDKDLPELGLRKGDRLEPSPELSDTAAFDKLRPLHGERLLVTFWRTSEETSVKHACPLFAPETGLSPARSIAVDWLHCLSLGIWLNYISVVIYGVIDGDAFGRATATARERRLHVLAELKARMAAWESEELKAGRSRTLPNNITSGMLGERGSACSLQGAEANAFLTFLVEVVLEEQAAAGQWWERITSAGRALVAMLKILGTHKGVVPAPAVQSFVDNYKQYCRLAHGLVKWVPKNHYTAHLCVQLRELGPPASFANWRDGQLDAYLKRIANRAHRRTWHGRALSGLRRSYGVASFKG